VVGEAGSGLIESAKRLVATCISIVSTRLELLGNELHEERLRLTRMLVLLLCALLLFGMGLLLCVALVVALFWDEHRLAVLGILGLGFLAGGSLMLLLYVRTQKRAGLFAASLAELAKDRARLGAGE
jgi:uncharacterized membrane protein YqjE